MGFTPGCGGSTGAGRGPLLRERNTMLCVCLGCRSVAIARAKSALLVFPSWSWLRARGWLRMIDFISRVPGRPALHDARRDSAPFGDLTVVGAHPVDWNRGEAALFAIAGEAEPARAELGGHGPAAAGRCAPVPHHPLLDQKNRVFNRGAALHSAALDRGGVDHPDLPGPPSWVEEGAVTGVLGGLGVHDESWGM